jgi:hypothetical protein
LIGNLECLLHEASEEDYEKLYAAISAVIDLYEAMLVEE